MRLLDEAGPACVAIKPQLARFEALGAPGVAALERICAAAGERGLLVVADGKRGDVPVSAAPYAASLLGSTPTPFGEVRGLGADAATVNPMLGVDSLEPWVEQAERTGTGLFMLVRTSNPGAADVLDLAASGPGGSEADQPLHMRIAAMVASFSERLHGSASGLSGAGAVVGATEPEHIAGLRAAMPDSIFLLPGVGAQGGDPATLGPAFAPGPASALVPASRSIVGAADPAAAAEALRETVWAIGGA